MNKTSIIDRVNKIYEMLENKYSENSYSETCPLFVKRYFDYKEISFVKNEFIPNLPYNIRGIYFIPLRVDYSNILYLFPRETVKENTKNVSNSNKVFRVMKTLKTDVYELYLKDGDNLVKKGVALIQNTELSHKILS